MKKFLKTQSCINTSKLFSGLLAAGLLSISLYSLNAQCPCPPMSPAPCPCVCPVKVLDYTLCDITPPYTSKVNISVGGYWRVITSNGIPDHPIGKFPLIFSEDLASLSIKQREEQCCCGRPNSITEQQYTFVIPLYPITGISPISTSVFVIPTPPYNVDPPITFGVAVNGVPFDPAAGEWWDPLNHKWAYNALRHPEKATDLDCNNGHVQPNGAYHYHGFPTTLYDSIQARQERDPLLELRSDIVLLGWAFDGSPIYGEECGINNAGINLVTSSYKLKGGARGVGEPPGNYNSYYVDDYWFDSGFGDLDECNGHLAPTPEYPEGVFHYHILKEKDSGPPYGFPYIGRCYSEKNYDEGPNLFPR